MLRSVPSTFFGCLRTLLRAALPGPARSCGWQELSRPARLFASVHTQFAWLLASDGQIDRPTMETRSLHANSAACGVVSIIVLDATCSRNRTVTS